MQLENYTIYKRKWPFKTIKQNKQLIYMRSWRVTRNEIEQFNYNFRKSLRSLLYYFHVIKWSKEGRKENGIVEVL
jgi:hypothetical protein